MILKKWFNLKILYKILTVILSIYWGVFGLGMAGNCVSRVYLYPLKYKEYVFKNAQVYGLDSTLIFSIIKVQNYKYSAKKANNFINFVCSIVVSKK